jgi:hypothetical protein
MTDLAPATDTAPDTPDPPPPADEAPADPAPDDPGHSFESLDDAVSALKETRAEAAKRRTENKELAAKVEGYSKYDTALAGYKPEEVDYLLELFHDLSDPKAQKRAAKELAEIAAKVNESDAPSRPTGEEDPDEQPLTKKEWKRLQDEKDQESAQATAIKQIEAEATRLGYPPDSKDYTLLLSEMIDPDVAGDVEKAAANVAAYKQGIIDDYSKQVAEGSEKWPAGTPPSSPADPSDPDAGPPIGWKKSRKAAEAWLKAKAGEA